MKTREEMLEQISSMQNKIKNISAKLNKFKASNTLERFQKLSDTILKRSESSLTMLDDNAFNKRIDVCKKCEFWKLNNQTQIGKCELCNRTSVVFRMINIQCPKGKW